MVVEFDAVAVNALLRGAEMKATLLTAGGQVAHTAAQLAPKDTGQGARSIRADLVTVKGVPEVHVSWDRDHYYMGMQEFGTEKLRPRPFLRPAANRYR